MTNNNKNLEDLASKYMIETVERFLNDLTFIKYNIHMFIMATKNEKLTPETQESPAANILCKPENIKHLKNIKKYIKLIQKEAKQLCKDLPNT